MPKNLRHQKHEAVRVIQGIVFRRPVIESEYLLVYVALKMKRFHGNVSAFERPLQQRPEIFHPVNVYTTAHISLSLVYHIVYETPLQSALIRYCGIGIDGRAKLDALENLILQRLACNVWNHLSTNLSQIAVKNAMHDGLVETGTSAVEHVLRALCAVHILDATANKSFVCFQFIAFATDFVLGSKLSPFHYFADSLKHEPCRRLRYSQRTAKFVRADSVLRICQKPKRSHPLIKGNRRVFHDRLDLDGELFFARVAEPQFAGFDKRVLGSRATGTYNGAIRPTQSHGKLKGAVRVGKVDNRFLECFRFWHNVGVHVKTIPEAHMCVN